MRVEPKTETEVAAAGLFAKGKYPFEVLEAAEGQSKAGNDMIEMKVAIYDGDKKRNVFDYLVSMDSMAYKIRHFADAVGMLKDYEAGNLDADKLIGCSGECLVDIDPEKNGYPAKNVIKDYVKSSDKAGVSASAPAAKPKAAAKAD